VLGCPILEAQFSLETIEPRIAVLSDGVTDVLDGASWELDATDLERLSALIGFVFPCQYGEVRLVEWRNLRAVPYLIHTEFELALMLEGRKPFAAFGDVYPSGWFEAWMARFDDFVAKGRFVRRIVDQPFPSPIRNASGETADGLRAVYVALRGEEWRIAAYIEMQKAAALSGWSEALERRQGELLGYEDWQCDWWITERQRLLNRRR
jgi:hypothetical protein